MDYKTLMVHLALEHPNDALLRVAGDLAEQFGASAIGVAACDHTPPPYFVDGAFAQSLLEKDRANLAARMAELEAEFVAKLKGRAKDIAWRSAFSRPNEYAAREARAADLIVVGADAEGTFLDPFRHLDVGSLIMQAGRPVFVVPPDAERLGLDAALVAWKDTREARRAVWDALPLLRKARDAYVVEAVENADPDRARTRVNDVVEWLRRHGVQAHARVATSEEPADALAAAAASTGAGLIVAGAYGHSRLSQWVFGGVTRSLLTRAGRCCLLSH